MNCYTTCGIRDSSELQQRTQALGLHAQYRDFRVLTLGHGATCALDAERQAIPIHGLEQVVHRLEPESLERILIVGGGKDEVRQRKPLLANLLDYAQAIETGHLNVQKDEFRFQIFDHFHGFDAMGAGTEKADIREVLEKKREFVA